MISLSPRTRVYCAVESVDFRNGIDGLSRLCQSILEQDPFSGDVFVFRNRRRTAIKMLFYDGQGFWLSLKRLSKGRFKWWVKKEAMDPGFQKLLASELQVLLWNGDPERSGVGAGWRSLA